MRETKTKVVRQMPNAAWAWEGLRRNDDYKRLWHRARGALSPPRALPSGAQLYRERRFHSGLLDFGLLAPADPRKSDLETTVFWRPDLFGSIVRVQLTPFKEARRTLRETGVKPILLSRFKGRRAILDTLSGERHIVINGGEFWFQLRADAQPDDDECCIGLNLPNRDLRYYADRLRSGLDLIKLYEADDAGKRDERLVTPETPLGRALMAYDVTRMGGSLKDVAAALYGSDRVAEDWHAESRYLKERARRARSKGEAFVDGEYKALLSPVPA